MDLAVLGPLEVRRGGTPLDLGKQKQRALLAALALWVGRPVSVDTLIDLVWGDSPPAAVTATLQSYVSTLRRVLEPDRPLRAPARILVTATPGYVLMLPQSAVDACRFDRVVHEQHARLQRLGPLGTGHAPRGAEPSPLTGSEVASAEAALADALQSWRGLPYQDLGDAAGVAAERSRLDELRLLAEEDRARASLALGRHAEVAARLEAHMATNPLHERLAALRAVALVRCGRQADALEILRRTRDLLVEDLGIEPGPEIRAVQEGVLRQEPWLEWHPPAGTRSTPGPAPAAETAARPATHPATHPAPTAEPAEPEAPSPDRRDGPARGGGRVFADSVAPWPMLGRDSHLAVLRGVLDAAVSRRPAFAVVSGEPGIGKTRLAREAAREAVEMGVEVAIGRSSQDDGAPPLWPWSTVLQSLGSDLAEVAAGESGQFAAWEQITLAVRAAARDRPVLLVLEDLHWADTSTLRVLRLLVETVEDERLAVLVSWRSRPEPTGALADVAETLARHHARRLELGGLGASDVAEVVSRVAGTRPSEAQARALLARTEGNPFFVVEYARLAEQRGDLDLLLAEVTPPTAVHEVVARRIDRLPASTRTALTVAAVIGRQFDAETLAEAAGIDPDELLDVIEPAQAIGLVREDGVDRYSFSHALVRDTVYADLSASRRARTHATVARSLRDRPGRETEEARHWLGAGTAHAAQAWRSAVRAAGVARTLHAHEQAAQLLGAALAAMDDDPAARPEERYDLLMDLVEAFRWAGMWSELTRTVESAVDVARALEDPVRVARAAISTTQGGLWQSAAYGQVNEPLLRALRTSLAALPAEDSPLRCRVLLGLANELYYGSTTEEKQAVVDEALGMARRIGDEALLLDACLIAFLGVWHPATAPERLRYAVEATELARRAGRDQASAVAATHRAVALAELGRPAEMREWATIARREAERLRLPYVLIVLANLELPWNAMAGRFDRCDELVDQSRRLDAQLGLRQSGDPTTGALLSRAIWRAVAGERPAATTEIPTGAFSTSATVVSYLWRLGAEDRAREHYARHPVRLDVEDWTSMLVWCNAAEVSLYLGDAAVGAAALERLAPYRGRSCSAGSSNAAGPVDAYLALAAAALGEGATARAHADRALELCIEWEVPLVARWLLGLRERYRF